MSGTDATARRGCSRQAASSRARAATVAERLGDLGGLARPGRAGARWPGRGRAGRPGRPAPRRAPRAGSPRRSRAARRASPSGAELLGQAEERRPLERRDVGAPAGGGLHRAHAERRPAAQRGRRVARGAETLDQVPDRRLHLGRVRSRHDRTVADRHGSGRGARVHSDAVPATRPCPPPPPARLPPAGALAALLQDALRERRPVALPGPGRRAAVLVVLIDRGDEAHVLLTKRSDSLPVPPGPDLAAGRRRRGVGPVAARGGACARPRRRSACRAGRCGCSASSTTSTRWPRTSSSGRSSRSSTGRTTAVPSDAEVARIFDVSRRRPAARRRRPARRPRPAGPALPAGRRGRLGRDRPDPADLLPGDPVRAQPGRRKARDRRPRGQIRP